MNCLLCKKQRDYGARTRDSPPYDGVVGLDMKAATSRLSTCGAPSVYGSTVVRLNAGANNGCHSPALKTHTEQHNAYIKISVYTPQTLPVVVASVRTASLAWRYAADQ